MELSLAEARIESNRRRIEAELKLEYERQVRCCIDTVCVYLELIRPLSVNTDFG